MSNRRFVFLRAINTGGRRLTNDEVVAPFLALGCVDVAAYQAAGNITFRPGDAHAGSTSDELEGLLETALAEAYGFDTPTFVRTAAELDAVLAGSPFTTTQLAATDGRVQVTFLQRPPDADRVSAVFDLVPDDDVVGVVDRHWYWLPRAGVSDSALPVGRIETVLGPMTMRTLGTIERMRRKFPD